MAIHYLLLEAKPEPLCKGTEDVGGAFVNCWVRARNRRTAERVAHKLVVNAGWIVTLKEEQRVVMRDEYWDMPESLRCFEEAKERGYCMVFHTWPIGEEPVN